jgi:membrane protein required for colicin V production
VNLVEAIKSINLFDLLVILGLFAMFILGFVQGTIRRLLGIASILFSLFLAAQLRDPLGAFLADNWTHLPVQYSYMIGFGTVFVAATIAFSLVIQGVYKRSPLFEKATFVDELLGGLLGVVQGLLLLGAAIIILDSYYRIQGIPPSNNELGFLRDFWNALNPSVTAAIYRDTLIPALFAVTGPIFPSDIRAYFPGGKG